MVIFPGPALISSVACNVVAFHGSVWLSALRQPAHHRAAPKCHTPSPWLPPVLRQSAQSHQLSKAAQAIAKSAGVHLRWFTAWRFPKVAANLKRCKNQVSNEQSAYRRPAAHVIRQNVCTSRKGSSACKGQTSSSQARFACAQRLFLLAAA